MNSSDWKNIIKTVAPGIAGILGGPLAATAVGALSQALLGKTDGTIDEIAAIVATGSPDILLKIKQTETDLQTQLVNAGIKLEELETSDRDSARKREESVHDNTPKILAYIYSGGYFAMVAALGKYGLPADAREIMLSLISILTAALLAIINYYFGASAGGARTREILGKVAGLGNGK